MILFHAGISIIVGITAAIIAYAIYRKASVSLWAYLAGFLLDLPIFILIPFKVSNLDNLLLFSHTAGIFIWPVILVILDIFLIEAQLLKYIVALLKLIHLGISNKSVKRLEKIDGLLERLEEYHIIPAPIRLSRVYIVGVMAGVVHLVINLAIGVL
ncbi:MAG: hypothetical protein ISS36_01405 [Candidatus Aenigmarchaeota archaeon]|nr:hypothetical protein [Candidatus Aenigmarchaeota archaeon]